MHRTDFRGEHRVNIHPGGVKQVRRCLFVLHGELGDSDLYRHRMDCDRSA